MEAFLDGSQVNILVAFVAGFVTFFASCLLPLVPTYLAYLSGVSLSSSEATSQRWGIVRVALAFVLGFITTFVILGMLMNQFAPLVAQYRGIANRVAGLLFMTLGLYMLGVFKSTTFSKEIKLDVHTWFREYKYIHAFLTGVAFGFGWTPCIGPVLAVILVWSAKQASMASGVLLLVTYGLGLGLPFVLVAAGFEKLLPLLKKYSRVSQYVMYLSGVVVFLAGALFFFGEFQRLSLILVTLLDLHRFTK